MFERNTFDDTPRVSQATLDRRERQRQKRNARQHRISSRRSGRPVKQTVALSHEQQAMLDAVADGYDVIVDATVGSGKTTAIQELCSQQPRDIRILYLTYSRLLKADAQKRVRGRNTRVQNYHGVVYPGLLKASIQCGIGESIAMFNRHFERSIADDFPIYDLLVVDEYQDINEEHAELLMNIRSLNPDMQIVMVGDMEQKVRSDTTLDVRSFVLDFCHEPKLIPFTQSFRMGERMAGLLAKAWKKPIVGANKDQTVRQVSAEEAVNIIGEDEPGDILCLGARNGQMATALNKVESRWPDIFNKNTVYASIRDRDGDVEYSDRTAVFTTFDSSKGLERPVCFVFDFDESMWDYRNSMPDAEADILRNIFLVAASRGKREIIFVGKDEPAPRSNQQLGFIPVHRFTNLNPKAQPDYGDAIQVSGAFDFKYAEHIDACFNLLERARLDDGSSPEINIDRADGLIDLSPAVGNYQEAVFFDNYNARAGFYMMESARHQTMIKQIGEDPWENSLILSAVETDQDRYVSQVDRRITEDQERSIIDRIGTLLPRDARNQIQLFIRGTATRTNGLSGEMNFAGVADVMHQNVIFELKFVSELSAAHFLQLAMYLVMSGYQTGILWNIRTNERWEVRVLDRECFMDAVAVAVSKGYYRSWMPSKNLG